MSYNEWKKIPILVAWNAPFDKGFFERSYFKMTGPLNIGK